MPEKELERLQAEADKLNEQELESTHKYWKKFKRKRHHGPPRFRLRRGQYKTSLLERVRKKIKGEEDADVGTPELTEDVVIATKTYL